MLIQREYRKFLQRAALISVASLTCFATPNISEAQVLLGELNPENKIISGAACVPTNTKLLQHFDVRASGIKNISDSAQWVTCSVSVDSEGEWDTYSVPLVVDGHANIHVTLDYSAMLQGVADTTCVAQVTVNSAVAESISNTVTANSGQMGVQLSITGLTMGDAQGSPAAISCLLPPLVKLNAVRLEEIAITDLSVLGLLL